MRMRLFSTLVLVVTSIGCGNDSRTPVTPTPVSEPVAKLTVTMDSLGSAVAIPGVSRVRFDASGSTAEGPVQYAVDFGDGSASTERLSDHVYDAAGIYRAEATITDARGRRASHSQTINVLAVEGTWFHFGYNAQTRSGELRRLTLTGQKGRDITGELAGPGAARFPVAATLEGERTLRFMAGDASIAGEVPSRVLDDGASFELTGFANVNPQTLAFRAVAGAPTGAPPFAKLDVDIDGFSKYAVNRFTPIRFSAERSQAESPTYLIEYGDGTVSTAPSDVRRCNFEGLWIASVARLTAKLTVVDRFGRAATDAQFMDCIGLANGVCGGWFNTFTNPQTGQVEHRRVVFAEQDGARIGGHYVHPASSPFQTPNISRFTGTLSGVRSIRMRLDGGGIEFTGELLLGSNYPPRMILVLAGGSADGATLEFDFVGGTYCK